MRYLWCFVLTGLLAGSLSSAASADDEGVIRNDPPARSGNGDSKNAPPSKSSTSGGKVDAKAVAELTRAEKLYTEKGDTKGAISIAQAQLKTFQQGDDYDHLVDALFLLGNAYFDQGDWANAEKFMTQANDLGWQHFPDTMGTGALKIIAESQYQQQHVDEALATFQLRVEKLRAQKGADPGELTGAQFDVAGTLINVGRPAEALPVLLAAEKSNAEQAAALGKAGSAATQDDKDSNVLDHAEIVYLQGVALFKQDKFAEAKPKLEAALGLFDGIQQTKRQNVADREVAVLDDLVVTSEKLGDSAGAEAFRAQRDRLNQ